MDIFLRTSLISIFRGLGCFMTFQESPELEMKFSGHVPLIWKRKVRNFIKSDPQQALVVFFENFKQRRDPNKMKYGLEQLLPGSLHLILSSFEELSQEEIAVFLELIAAPSFLSHISNLNKEKQETILIHIYDNWTNLNQEFIRMILSHLDSDTVELLYDKISTQSSLDSAKSIEIMQLWGSDIFPFILNLYLISPVEEVKPLFKELKSSERVQLFHEARNLSKKRLENLLCLVSPTEEEIGFIFTLKPPLGKESKLLLTNWLIHQNLDLNFVFKVYQVNKTTANSSMVIDYLLINIIKKYYLASDVIFSALSLKEFSIAHDILAKLSPNKTYNSAEILVTCLTKLQDQVLQYSKFFQSEFQNQIAQNLELILIAYLESQFESHHQLLLPMIAESAKRNWKKIIKTVVERQTLPPSNLVFDIFSTCPPSTKQQIGNYIISQSWVPQLIFLFSDFEIFVSALIFPKKLSITFQVVLEPLLQQHIIKHFEAIVKLGKKIALPQVTFATLMDDNRLEILLNIVGSSKDLLDYWRETFIYCAKQALPILLKDYLVKERKQNDLIIPLLNELVTLELPQFWIHFGKIPVSKISNLKLILTHAFEHSISNICDLICHSPEPHQSFLIENTLPSFVSSGTRILYSLFSSLSNPNVSEQVQRLILATVRLDPSELLVGALFRCSKLISSPNYSTIVSSLVDRLFSTYPEAFLVVVDTYRLVTLTASIKVLLSSSTKENVEHLLLTLIPKLKSEILKPILSNQLILLSKEREDTLSLLHHFCMNYEKQNYSTQGEDLLSDLVQYLVKDPSITDLSLFKVFLGKPRSQSLLLPVFFRQTSQETVEEILLNPPIIPLEKKILKIIMNHFESQPPDNPEDYFFSLYNKVEEVEEVQKALLPLLGEFCSWQNLSILIELPEKEKYQKEYDKALSRFSSRFNIHSPKALRQIWISGLRDVYGNKQRIEPPLLRSQCPQCGNPILENQKNCGFCTQRLICIICRKSVVQLQIEEGIVQCPQCSSFFHRRHLIESIKIKDKCPVCNATLREAEVAALPEYSFSFH